jgi:hypothetical protein
MPKYSKEYKERVVQGEVTRVFEKRWSVGKLETMAPTFYSGKPAIRIYYDDHGKEKRMTMFIWGRWVEMVRITPGSCEEELIKKMITIFMENNPETTFNEWMKLLKQNPKFAELLERAGVE